MNFKELKNKIKEEQKQLAQKIKICKSLRKPKNFEVAPEEMKNIGPVERHSIEYRHRHIVYCEFFNGTPYDKIEKKSNNSPNNYYLKKIQKEWESQLDEVVCNNP